MQPARYLEDGSLNPDWVAWADARLAALDQSAGHGVEDVAGPHGLQLREPEADGHWVRVVEVDADSDPPRHGVEEVFRDPAAEVPYDWAVRPGGLKLELPGDWAAEASGASAAPGDVVFAVRDGAGRWTFALGGGTATSDWRPGWVTSVAGSAYTVQPIKLNSAGVYVTDGATVSPCYRMPTKEFEAALPEVPVQQSCLWRPSPHEAGKYEMTPWGGLKKHVVRHLHYTCTRCEETTPGSGVYVLKTYRVYRRLRYYARDARITFANPPTSEAESIGGAVTGG